MKTNTNERAVAQAEELLAAAGITATAVADCEDHGCAWCRQDPLPLVA